MWDFWSGLVKEVVLLRDGLSGQVLLCVHSKDLVVVCVCVGRGGGPYATQLSEIKGFKCNFPLNEMHFFGKGCVLQNWTFLASPVKSMSCQY